MSRRRPTGLSAAHTAKGRLQRELLKQLTFMNATGMLPTSGRFLFYELVQARGGVEDRHRGAAARPEHHRRADAPTRGGPGAVGLDRGRDPLAARVRRPRRASPTTWPTRWPTPPWTAGAGSPHR